jgi:clathrin heavy chain
MQVNSTHGIIYLITKFGYLHVLDLQTGQLIYRQRIDTETIFVTALHEASGGLIGINRKGRVLGVTVDEKNIIPYICATMNNYELGIILASRNGWPGANELFANQFKKLLASGDIRGAAKVAADSPGGFLRTPDTLNIFRQLPVMQGQPSPLLQYFAVVMEKGKLNSMESVELARPVLQQGKKDMLEKWIKEDKLTFSEELADLIKPLDANLALVMYSKAEAHGKVVITLAEMGQHDRIPSYCQKFNYKADFMGIISSLVNVNPDAAANFAKSLVGGPSGSLIDVNTVVEMFLKRSLVPQTTSVLLEYLKGNRKEDAALQTKLLEINLISAPNVADAILANDMLTFYDKNKIATLCERAGLFLRALANYSDINDIKRAMANAASQPNNWETLVAFFSKLDKNDALECLKNLLRVNIRSYTQLVVQICTKYSAQLEPLNCIEVFEQFKAAEGLFFYLGGIVNSSDVPEVHNKYIEAAARTGQIREVERVVKESNYYDAKRIKEFLKEAKLPDQLPLIIVCDRFDFVDDLTKHLYKNNMSRYIEAYVQKINPSNTPAVVGALIDVGCNEEYIKNLLLSVRSMCPVEGLVEVVEAKHKLKIILPWLEARVNEGAQEPEVHNALAKIVIDTNKGAEEFLLNNRYYDHKLIGKYCEKRDPNLAVVAYKAGQCDAELIEVTNKNGLFKQQARYLVQRQSIELWGTVLVDTNENRRSLIDQVVQTALPEVKNADEISSTVKAFMNANLPDELLELLEKIVLGSKNAEFAANPILQDLLIVTAIQSNTSKVMDYVTRLEKYTASDMATNCLEAGLYEEAFTIYNKFKMNVDAVGVLLKYMQDLDKAAEFAERHNMPEVFKELGKAQLAAGHVKNAIASFLKAKDTDLYENVIYAAGEAGCYAELVKFLEMCHQKVKNPKIETELVFAYAKTHQLTEMQHFVEIPGCTANLIEAGDRCFDQGLYDAAKILFQHINDWAKLASTLVRLKDYAAAVDAANKANNLRSWREINISCVEAKEFKHAQTAGVHLVLNPDELEECLRTYESRGYFSEVIQLCESVVNHEGAHSGLFTELAGLYSKYKEEKLMAFLKEKHASITSTKVISYCQMNCQWSELVFLYMQEKEYDNAALTMINHSAECWENGLFKEAIAKVSAMDNCYRAIQFYVAEQPALLGELLGVLTPLVDPSRVVGLAKKLNVIPLVHPYLAAVQEKDITAVNEALNELYIEEEDFASLRASVEKYHNFNATLLAGALESNSLLEFRRIASFLYKRLGNFAHSMDISKKDKMYKDAIQTAADSKKADIAEALLNFFVQEKQKECFAATLYSCYDLLKPDVVMELGWRNGMTDMIFPYMIQVMKEYTHKVDVLHKELEQRKKDEDKKSHGPDSFSVADPVLGGYNGPLQIAYFPQNNQGFPGPQTGMGPMGFGPTGFM